MFVCMCTAAGTGDLGLVGLVALTKNQDEFKTQSLSSCSSCRLRASICEQGWSSCSTAASGRGVSLGIIPLRGRHQKTVL